MILTRRSIVIILVLVVLFMGILYFQRPYKEHVDTRTYDRDVYQHAQYYLSDRIKSASDMIRPIYNAYLRASAQEKKNIQDRYRKNTQSRIYRFFDGSNYQRLMGRFENNQIRVIADKNIMNTLQREMEGKKLPQEDSMEEEPSRTLYSMMHEMDPRYLPTK